MNDRAFDAAVSVHFSRNEREQLNRFSKALGDDFLLVQGAGGNTSLKSESQILVKASGTELRNAESEELFTMVDRNSDPLQESFAYSGRLKPSIETNMHLLLPHKVVAHVHAVEVIALSVLKDAENPLSKLFAEMNWVFVPYVKPGLDLSHSINHAIKRAGAVPDVVVLGNHGLVVGADGFDEATVLLKKIVEMAANLTRKVDHIDAQDFATIDGLVPVNMPVAHIAALDPSSFAYAKSGTLYPDHVVFLGRGVSAISKTDPLPTVLPTKRSSELLLVEGQGAYLPQSATQRAHEMAAALALVVSRIPENQEVNVLTEREESELLDWDAEKYRQSLYSVGLAEKE